ncbi:MAG TPA: molybdopterin-dependent oxidoreductase [Mycobacteriales bacterium]|nr:molybdopterin-dependent oxidoreductase [Mycobacteriales bacterium]
MPRTSDPTDPAATRRPLLLGPGRPRLLGMARARLLGPVVLVLALTAGCGGADGPGAATGAGATGAPAVVRPASLRPGQPVPVPAGKAVLTLTGKVSADNRGATVAFDRPALERIGLVRARLHDPWAKEEIEVRGIRLRDLLAVAGAPATATSVHITALDDYQVDLGLADVRAGGVLLATAAGDGSAIAVEDGGPTRIVFLDGVPAGGNADHWIWSLKTIEVR